MLFFIQSIFCTIHFSYNVFFYKYLLDYLYIILHTLYTCGIIEFVLVLTYIQILYLFNKMFLGTFKILFMLMNMKIYGLVFLYD